MQNKPRESNDSDFMALLNFLADPTVIVDEKGVFLAVNDAAENLTGLSKKEHVGTNFLEMKNLSPETKAIIVENLRKRMQGLHVEPYEISLTDKDGQTRYFELKAKKIDYAGKAAVIAILRDITRRKENLRLLTEYSEKMEALVNEKVKEIKESEAKYREVINKMNDTVWVTDFDGKFIDVNDAAVKVLGYSREELLRMGPPDIDSSLTKEQILDLIKNMPADQIQVFETSHTAKDGTKIPVEISSSLVTYQGKQAILSIARVITERKKAEAKLLASEKKYRRLFKNLKRAEKQLLEERDRAQNYLDIAGVMLVALDTKGRVTLLNRKGCAILKCTAEEALGKNWFDNFLPKDTKNNVKKIFQASIKGKKCLLEYNENYVVPKSGEARLIAWHNVLLRNSRGQVIGTLSSGEDITKWKKAQQALIDSEEKFRSIVENSNDVVMLTLPNGIVSYMSPACFRVLGYNPEDLVGTRPSIFHPDDLEVVNKTLSKALKGEKGSDLEYRIITKAGETRWISHSWSPILENGKVKLIVSIVRGITERKQLEDALRASEEMFRAISTCASDAIILLDETDQVVYWNPAAERIFGYAKEEAIGKKLVELVVPPKFRNAHLETLKAVLGQKSQIAGKRIEVPALRKDGTEFPIELTVAALKLNDASYMLEIIRDISERKKMEDALKQERDMLEAVTENVGAGLAIISKDYRILWANKLLKQLNGDCEGKTCYSTFNRLTEVCPDCGVKKVFEEGVPIDVHEYVTKDDKGNTVWVELIVTPIKDEEENVIAALELAVNITERKIMQNKLAEYSQALEKLVEQRTDQLKQTQAKLVKSERLATIGELAAMVGHDLRNPLTGIMGATYYLKTKHGAEVGAKGKEMLETIEKAIKYSNKIINDLLEYSRDLKLEFTETTPKVILQSALSLLEVPENIQIVDATEDEPTIKVDTEKMRNVFVRIIQNAIDAMPEGGTLTVESKKVNGTLEIAFKDTGVGLSEEALSKLEGGVPLFTTKAKGMGFGLPICRRLTEAHGGKLSVESTAGKGTTVTVTIPVNPEPVEEGEEKWIFSESMLSAITSQRSRRER